MEKIVWDTLIVPGLRERLIERYVPKEPIDPLVYKVTAFYWLMQELVGNWKTGRRLTLDQKAKLLEILVWNLSRVQEEQAAYQPNIIVESFDINISQETTEQIAQLVIACKEFQS
jgi:uncharacterized protein YeaC (DUF1315 family)